MTMDIMNISNEELGSMLKSDPNMMMYLQLNNEIKGLKSDIEEIRANQELLITKSERHDDSINNLESSQTEVKEKVEHLEDFNFVLRNYPKEKRELSKIVKDMVKKYTGKSGSVEYVLFYRTFIKNCYKKITDALSVDSSLQIRIDDIKIAYSIAKKWYPERFYINKKILEYQQKQYENRLNIEKSKSLELFLEKTNGGTKLPW